MACFTRVTKDWVNCPLLSRYWAVSLSPNLAINADKNLMLLEDIKSPFSFGANNIIILSSIRLASVLARSVAVRLSLSS